MPATGAVSADCHFDSDLQTVIDAWPNLPDHLRAAVLALVRSVQ